MLLQGMHLPLTTPFFADGRLNLRKLEQNVARYSLTPAAGMVVLGQPGEANLLTDAESEAVFRVAIQAAKATKVMLAAVALDGVSATLTRIGLAASLGYDAAVLTAPVLPGISVLAQGIYLRGVADHCPLPLVLRGVGEELLSEMAFHPRVLGYSHRFTDGEEVTRVLHKTAAVQRNVTVTPVFGAVTGRMRLSQPKEAMVSAESLRGSGSAVISPAVPTIKTRTKQVGFQILVENTERMLSALLAGALGAVPPFSVCAPQACYEVFAAWKDGDTPLADEKQARLVNAARVVEEVYSVAGLKYGCDLNGYFGGVPRLPLLPLLGEQKEDIERLMEGLRG